MDITLAKHYRRTKYIHIKVWMDNYYKRVITIAYYSNRIHISILSYLRLEWVYTYLHSAQNITVELCNYGGNLLLWLVTNQHFLRLNMHFIINSDELSSCLVHQSLPH